MNTILLVEDNPSDLELALHALKKHELVDQVTVARDGVEALDYLFGTNIYQDQDLVNRPKVIFLDLKLPKIDGWEVLQRVRADTRTRNIPVVILTSSSEERDLVQGYELGANSYVLKPVDFTQFTEAVHHLGFYWLTLNHLPGTQ